MRFPQPRLRAIWRQLRLPLITALLYLALQPVLTAMSDRHGFGSPGGLSLAYLAVTALSMTLRLTLLIIVPAVLAYRVTVYAITHILGGTDSPTQSSTKSDEHADPQPQSQHQPESRISLRTKRIQ